MQFSWAETPAHDGGSETKVGGDLSTYENLYGNELQLFESFFNGNLNELDYLSDLSSLPEGTEPRSELPASDPIDLLFVKHEPTSPQSSVGTPSSPGESSGPSSPETLFHHHISTLSTETIDPSSLTMPSAFPLGLPAEPLMEVKKQSAKRARALGSEEEDATAPLMPSTGVPDEERHVKRQRRLIKNRESAQKSRLRKKMYIEDLETKVKSLATHNDALLQENSALKEEINFLTKFINKTPGLAEEIAHSRPKGTAPIRNVKAAGVCLLIVLFSFGLFFNNVQQLGDHGPALPFEGGAREPIPEVVPFGGQRRYGHMLKSFKDAAAPLVAETEEAVGDLTPIFPKRRLPLADAGPLDSVIQRNKKVGSGLSPYKKIKLEEDSSMDVVDPSCMEELANGFVVPQLSSSSSSVGCSDEDVLALAVSAHTGPRNDTGAEMTGHTDN